MSSNENNNYLFDKLDENCNIENSDELINEECFDNLVNSLDEYLEKGTNKNSIIGITGKWGSGKTSFCKYLESKLSKKNYIFCFYDLWHHQDDYLKKSVLVELTTSLLAKGTLGSGAFVEAPNFFEWMHDNHVGSKKNYLDSSLSKKISIVIIFGFVLWCLNFKSNLFNFLNEVIICIKTNFGYDVLLLSYLVVAVPLLLFFWYFFALFIFHSPFKELIHKTISFFTNNKTNLFSEESCNSDLSVRDFQFWLKTIYANLKKDESRVVLILDNLDRLPCDKVKELFSLIQDVFSCLNEKNYANSDKKIHVFVPFDYESICRTFDSKLESNQCLETSSLQSKSKKEIKENDDNSELNSDNDNDINNQQIESNSVPVDTDTFQYTEDILDKTFSTIFYIPHINPYNYKDFFESKLSLIIKNWIHSLILNINSHEKLDNLKQEICYLEDNIDGQLGKTKENCWQIFIHNKDYNDLSIRKVLSFLRQLHVLLCINSKNFFYDNYVSFRKIILYAAYYSSNVSLFRCYSFANVMNIIKDDWKNVKFGISPIFNLNNVDSKNKSIEANQNEIFFTYMQIFFYQASKEELYSGELFYQTLVDGFKYNNHYLIENKLNGKFFNSHSDIVIRELLQRVDISEIIDFFEQVLSGKNKAFEEQNKWTLNIDVWKNVYILVIQKAIFNAYSERLGNSSVYSFFKKLFEIKLSKLNLSLTIFNIFLLVSYIKLIIIRLVESNAGKVAVSSIIAYISKLLTLENLVKDNCSICDSYLLSNVKNNGIDDDLFESLKEGLGRVSLLDDSNKKCVISSGLYDINSIFIQIVYEEKLLEAFKSINNRVVFKYLYDKSSCVAASVNWSLPVSEKARNLFISNIIYSNDNEINLCDEFITVFSKNNRLDNFEASTDNIYKLFRYIYKYALLRYCYDRRETMSIDNICKLLNIREDALLMKSRASQSIDNLSPFVQFLINLDTIYSIHLSSRDLVNIRRSGLKDSAVCKYDQIKDAFYEFFDLYCALMLIYAYTFMDKDIGKKYIDKLYSDTKGGIIFFLNALLNRESGPIDKIIDYFSNNKTK